MPLNLVFVVLLASAVSCTSLNSGAPARDADVNDGGQEGGPGHDASDVSDAGNLGSMDAGDTPLDDASEPDDASMVDETVDDASDVSPDDAGADAEPSANQSPTVTIDFPVSGVVDRTQVRVRGRVSDPDGDALSVTIAGASADVEGDGGFALTVALSSGTNEIEVEVTDGRGGEASASVDVERRGALFASPFDLAIHAASGTAWIADFLVGVIELDLQTHERRLLNGSSAIPMPVGGIAVAPDGSRLFATTTYQVTPESQRVVVMERARDGTAWSVLAIPAEGEQALQGPLRFDAVRNRLIALGSSDVVWGIDLAPGASRGTLSQITTAPSGYWMDYRSDTNELLSGMTSLVSGRYSTIQRTALGTGSTSQVWSAPSGTSFMAASGVAFNGSSAYVSDWSRGVIHSMDLSSGALALHSGPSSSGPQLMLPEAIVRDDTTLYVIDSGLGALFSIDNSGSRAVVSARNTGTGQGFYGPTGLTFDASGDRFLVMDSDPRAGLMDDSDLPSHASLIQVDRRTANRRLISGADSGSGALLPWGTSTAMRSSGVALATTNSMGLFSSEEDSGSLLEIDLESGDRRVVSGATEDDTVVGTGPSLNSAIQVVVESGIHALVLQRDKIVRVHLPTGNRVIISGPDGSDVQGSGPALSNATGFVLDDRTDPPLAYVANRDAVVEVDLGSGNRRIISADTDTDDGPPLIRAGGIALDVTHERVIIVTPELFRSRDVFMQVSLEDGARSFLSAQDAASAATRGDSELRPDMASGLYFDAEARVLWSIDWSLRSLQALDADTGEAILFSHFGR